MSEETKLRRALRKLAIMQGCLNLRLPLIPDDEERPNMIEALEIGQQVIQEELHERCERSGRWVEVSPFFNSKYSRYGFIVCSKCGYGFPNSRRRSTDAWNFCPRCGTKMEDTQDGND